MIFFNCHSEKNNTNSRDQRKRSSLVALKNENYCKKFSFKTNQTESFFTILLSATLFFLPLQGAGKKEGTTLKDEQLELSFAELRESPTVSITTETQESLAQSEDFEADNRQESTEQTTAIVLVNNEQPELQTTTQEASSEEKKEILFAARSRFLHRENQQRIPGIRLENLQKLSTTCSICLSDFIYDADSNHVDEDGGHLDQYVTLSNNVEGTEEICAHAYHTTCVLTWLITHPATNTNCFLCARPAFTQKRLTSFRILSNENDEHTLHQLPETSSLFMNENNEITYFDVTQGHNAFWEYTRFLRNFALDRALFYSYFHLLNKCLAINPKILPLLLIIYIITEKPAYPLDGLPQENEYVEPYAFFRVINNRSTREALYHSLFQLGRNMPDEAIRMSHMNGTISLLRLYLESLSRKETMLLSHNYLKYRLRQIKQIIKNIPQKLERYRREFNINNINPFAQAFQPLSSIEPSNNNEPAVQQQTIFNRLLQASNTIGNQIYQTGSRKIAQACNSFAWLTEQTRRFRPA